MGAAVLDLTFSKWDEAVSISAPPPDQVAPADLTPATKAPMRPAT